MQSRQKSEKHRRLCEFAEDIQRLLTERGVDVTLPWYEDKSPLPIEVGSIGGHQCAASFV